MKMKKVRIGLLGAGRIGKLHGENLAHAVPEAELYAVADPFMNDATRSWAADMGIEKCYDDPEKIFNDPSIEAVFICSSTNTHAEFIMRAAKAGKHIFCEKPIDYDIDKIKKLLALVEEKGVKFQVGFNAALTTTTRQSLTLSRTARSAIRTSLSFLPVTRSRPRHLMLRFPAVSSTT